MKLTKEEIQFIDTYLVKSEVFYVDVRQEMIDHVAYLSFFAQAVVRFNQHRFNFI